MNTSLVQVADENGTDAFNETMEVYPDDGFQYNYEYYFYLFNLADIAAQRKPELRVISYIMYKYLLPATWIISLLGNSLIVCVLLRKKNRNHSMSVYLTSLALADLGVNTNNNLVLFILINGHISPPMSDLDCCRDIFSFAISLIAAWMLVMVSLERFIIVFDPIRGKRFCTAKLARIVSISVWLIFLCLSVAYHAIFIEHVQLTISVHTCLVKDKYLTLHSDVIGYVIMALKFFIPFILIFATTTFIIFSLLNRKIRKSSSNQRQNNSLSIVLVIINIIYLVTQFPYTFLMLAAETLMESMSLLDQLAYVTYWKPLLIYVGDLNSAANVFVYFLTGSRFRNDTIEMVSGWIPKSWKTARKSKPTQDDGFKSTAVQPVGKERGKISQKESFRI